LEADQVDRLQPVTYTQCLGGDLLEERAGGRGRCGGGACVRRGCRRCNEPDFERDVEGSGAGSLSGWGASGGALSLVAGNGGGHAARVTTSAAGAQVYAYTASKPVKTTTASTAYTLDGTVRSSTGGTVC
jgi:hypothetical protein